MPAGKQAIGVPEMLDSRYFTLCNPHLDEIKQKSILKKM